jgi:replicative DNA helicase
MAADNEHRLVSKVIRDRDIIPALQRDVKANWFLDDDNRRVWEFVISHYNEYNEVPTAVVVKDHYPNYKVLDVEDTIDYLLDTMVTFRRNLLTRQGLEAAIENLQENNHEAALIAMEGTLTRVNEQGVLGTHEMDLSKNVDERYKEYKSLQNQEFLGIPTGFEKIDEATAGLQGGQLITIIAPPKTGKSQIALKIAINIHEQGKVPMFQSFEMNNKEQQQRHDSIRANISHTRLRRGKLTPAEDARYVSSLNKIETMQSFHLVDAVNGLTVSSLAAKIQQTKPDVVFVDGVYLMLDEISGEMNTPQAITNITRGLKRLAQKINKPVIITTQTLLWKMRGGKVTADSIGYSSSFFQDSDVILGLEPVEEDEEVRKLRIVSSRNCPPTETPITWNWETGCFHDEDEMSKCSFCLKHMANR